MVGIAATEMFKHAPLETVNPADLVIHSNDNAIMTVLDDNTWCETGPTEQWQQAPIYAGRQSEALQVPPTAPMPIESEAGFERLMWTGDLSFSSYGSSPADNSNVVTRLARQLRQQNIGPTDRARMARSISSTSIANETPKKHRTNRHRGRLYADMSFNGPETVFEDSDSHHSWTASDNSEDWCSHLRARLLDFGRSRERTSIITSQLQTRQRRKVHSMANLWGLSHMSLGIGREKKMLLTKCELIKGPSSQKRWNPTRDNWYPGLVDPTIVLVDNISPTLSADRLSECLRDMHLPVPQRLTIDSCGLGNHRTSTTAYIMFSDADEAITALLALDGTRPNWNAVAAELEADHVRFPPGIMPAPEILQDAFHALPDLLHSGSARLHHTSHADNSSDSEESEPETSTPRRRCYSSAAAAAAAAVRDSGYLSGHSSGTSTQSRKRKRVPKIAGGYACRECGKVFDRDGDRRKHEKNHNARRDHVCDECGKAFLFAKDLRRHGIVHSGIGSGSLEASSLESGVTQPIPIAGIARRMYSRSKPVEKRVSRLSTSLG